MSTVKTCYLIDIDDTLMEHGTETFLPGAAETLDQIISRPGAEVWFFTARKIDFFLKRLLSQRFPAVLGFLEKPVADRYVMVDDRLVVDECRTWLGC